MSAENGTPAIALRGVVKRYGAKVAVHRLDLEVRAGEILAVLGPNGAGKTTTLKMIAGLLFPSEGTVVVCGHDLAKEGLAAKKLLGYVPDQPYLYEKLSAREFMEFIARVHDLPAREREARIGENLDLFGVTGYADELIETYSHGMRQRVVLAATRLHAPRVLLVDEPLVGLDPQTSKLVCDLFRRHATDGGTVLLSTHTLSVAESTATRIAILSEGNLAALGTLDELRAQGGGNLEDVFFRMTKGRE